MAKACIETRLGTFIHQVARWDPTIPDSNAMTFDAIMFGAFGHAALLGKGGEFIQGIARRLGVTEDEVRRWTYGGSRPPDRRLKEITQTIVDLLRQTRNEIA